MKFKTLIIHLFVLLIFFFSYTAFAGDTLKVMTYNLEGMKPGSNPETRLENIIIKLKEINPDIIGLQEINEAVNGNGEDNQAKRIADSLSAFFGITYHYYISMTHLSWNNQFREFVGIITKYPVENQGFFPLVPGVFPRKVVWNLIDTPIGKINFFNTHLSYNSESVRVQQVQQIISFVIGKEINNPAAGSILTGDFNATPIAPSVQQLTTTGTDTFYVDTFAEANPGNLGYTFPSNSPNERIDFIFYKNTGSLSIADSKVVMKQPYSGNNFCSDHFGVLTRFTLNPVGIDDTDEGYLPQEIQLYQNYPNPFNPTTNIKFQISEPGFTELKIFDLLGKEVRTIVNENMPPGSYNVNWDGKDNTNRQLSSGVYLYRLKSGNLVQTKKLILLR